MAKTKINRIFLYVSIIIVLILTYLYYSVEGFSNNQTISFISYGNDNFISQKERIYKEAVDMEYFNGTIKIYEPNDLSEEFKNATNGIINEKRGGGYWLWKPYIINDMLTKLNDNDILVYADAGCSLNRNGIERLNEYIQTIAPSTNRSVFAMRLNHVDKSFHLEKKWTSTKIFEYFNKTIDSEEGNSRQILATTSIYRKCPESMEIVKKWLDIAQTHPDLFTDRYNKESKQTNPEFKENRHDQSIFSMILKNKLYANNCIIIDEEIEMGGGGKYLESSPIKATRKRDVENKYW
jgi:hypothetical protein